MVALKIEDIREFTSKLFVKETFDRFLVKEAQIHTFAGFSIDGRLRKGYFSEEELEAADRSTFVSWSMIRPYCFQMIKGKRLPESFSIVLQLPKKATDQFGASFGLTEGQLGGLYLNIRYEEGALYCVTGISLNYFTMDKSLENLWDQRAEEFLKKQGVACSRG